MPSSASNSTSASAASMSAWRFAIDVGGTFTDCLARAPDGRLLRHKLLSSGIVKGSIGPGSTADRIFDAARQQDPAHFWEGFRCSLFDASGKALGTHVVDQFDHVSGSFDFLTSSAASSPPFPVEAIAAGGSYELACDLEAPVIGIRYLLGLPLIEAVPPLQLRLGTTRGTNALLTRSGARTALLTTHGFGDLLEIGYQDRPDLFALTIDKPSPLIEASIEILERVSASGEVLIPLDEDRVTQQLTRLRQQGLEALAICLLHADLYPAHEAIIAARAAALGFSAVSCSSQVAPLVKIVARAETTVVDAYLTPVLRDYLDRLQAALPESQIQLMTSAGGLVTPAAFRGHESVLSGPAGGVVGYAHVAAAAGFDRAIGFDMGGTSTDVSRFDGAYEFEFESRKAGARLMAPTLAIETVAAGGGSICHFDGTRLTVGPESAGADPGPACYGRGGPLTVTDLNFYLGRIAVDRFPFALQLAAVEKQLEQVATALRESTGEQLTSAELAAGLLQIANANMARAVRDVSIAKGADPSDYVMVAFGGAASQHACAVARELGIRQILSHADASLLSAYGIGQADVVRHAAIGWAAPTSEVHAQAFRVALNQLIVEPIQQVLDAGCTPAELEILYSLDVRYAGTDAALNVPIGSGCETLDDRSADEAEPTAHEHWRLPIVQEAAVNAEFAQRHQRLFGYLHHDRGLEIVAARVQVQGKTKRRTPSSTRCSPCAGESSHHATAWFAGKKFDAAVFQREALPAGARLLGPAMVADPHSTIVVEEGWQAERLSGGELLLTDQGAAANSSPNDSPSIATQDAAKVPRSAGSADSWSAAVMLEVFNNRFAGIAEQMGHVLRRTAGSVNVKERLDYSCAVFTAAGELVANAPHVPVHLGSMGASVRAILQARPQMVPGDVYVTNDPYQGGSHLPDVTVVTPVHGPPSAAIPHRPPLLFFTACRAHHAEIGGKRAGSMPPSSRSLSEEGVLISNFALVDNGISREAELQELLASGSYPSRRVAENLADLRAQVAANRQGAHDLLELVKRYSYPFVQTQVANMQQAAEAKVRSALQPFKHRQGKFIDYLETADGRSVPIQVQLQFHAASHQAAVTIDFEGSAAAVAGNLNANRAIVTAAVLYVLRLLIDEDLPLNEGVLRAVAIVLPTGLLNPIVGDSPETTPAVAAGNVETSQRVVDVLLGALGVAGASQGTMNNLLFGDSTFGYYETICGGSGATAKAHGADAVQVHMTNTRATDPEVLERRLPVRLREFSIRRGSGGAGRHRGGNGVVRRLEFLQPLELSLITQRRGAHPPYGAEGGKPGQPGRNELIRAGGQRQTLPGTCEVEVGPGDVLIIHTPGGGGFGKA